MREPEVVGDRLTWQRLSATFGTPATRRRRRPRAAALPSGAAAGRARPARILVRTIIAGVLAGLVSLVWLTRPPAAARSAAGGFSARMR
jgi:hypothetical protein